MTFEIEQTIFEPVPTGTYTAEIRELVQEAGQFGEQVKIPFEIVDGEHAGTALIGWASATFSRRSKLYKWTRATFGGRDIPPDYSFRSDDLIGRRVLLEVIVKVKPDGEEYSKIEEVRAYRPPANGQGQPEAAPQQTAAAQQPQAAAPQGLAQQPEAPPLFDDDIPF
mgnify:CR=1 FL=1